VTPEQIAKRCLDTETAEDVDSRMVPADVEARIAAAVAAERARLARVAEAWRRAGRESGNVDEAFVYHLGADFLDELAAEFPAGR
jgi:hypothetical protein